MKRLLIILFIILPVLCFTQVEESESPKKFYNSITFSANLGGNFDDGIKSGLGMRTSMGHVFNSFLKVGAGIGVDIYQFKNNENYSANTNIIFFPVFAEIRGDIMKNDITPFYAMELGYGFKTKGKWNNYTNQPAGIYFRPQMGWKFMMKNNVGTRVSLGYLLQSSKEKYGWGWGEDVHKEKHKKIYQRYSIEFGIDL